jgi:membrane protein CcdC involved in cytochrome C biogenesis
MARFRKHKRRPKPLPATQTVEGIVASGQEAAAESRPAFEKQVLLGYLLLAAGLIFLLVGYLTHRLVEMVDFFNSDTLLVPGVYRDLIHLGGGLHDWYLMCPPYFFPDYALFFVTSALAPSPYWAIAAYFIAQVVLTFFAVAWLNRLFLDRGKAFLFAGMSLLSLCYLCMKSKFWLSPFKCLALATEHYGSFVAGLFVLRLALMAVLWPERRVKKTHLCLIFFLSLLASLSDAIFVMQFCAPLVIASIYLWAKCVVPLRRVLSVATSTVTGVACGFALYGHLGLNLPFYPEHIDLAVFSRNALRTESIFLSLWHTFPTSLALCALVWATFFCMWAFVDKLEEFQLPLSGEAKFLTAFCLALGGLVLVACLISSQIVWIRYFIPVFFFPFFVAPYATLAIRRSGLRMAVILVCMAGVCAAATTFLASNPQPFVFRGDYYPEKIQCMDAAFKKYGLNNGVAQYWDARSTVFLAKTPVNIAQLTPNLENYEWLTSKRTFRNSYDFAIIDLAEDPSSFYRLNEAQIKAINGQPRDTILCGQEEILVYPKNGLRLH